MRRPFPRFRGTRSPRSLVTRSCESCSCRDSSPRCARATVREDPRPGLRASFVVRHGDRERPPLSAPPEKVIATDPPRVRRRTRRALATDAGPRVPLSRARRRDSRGRSDSRHRGDVRGASSLRASWARTCTASTPCARASAVWHVGCAGRDGDRHAVHDGSPAHRSASSRSVVRGSSGPASCARELGASIEDLLRGEVAAGAVSEPSPVPCSRATRSRAQTAFLGRHHAQIAVLATVTVRVGCGRPPGHAPVARLPRASSPSARRSCPSCGRCSLATSNARRRSARSNSSKRTSRSVRLRLPRSDRVRTAAAPRPRRAGDRGSDRRTRARPVRSRDPRSPRGPFVHGGAQSGRRPSARSCSHCRLVLLAALVEHRTAGEPGFPWPDGRAGVPLDARAGWVEASGIGLDPSSVAACAGPRGAVPRSGPRGRLARRSRLGAPLRPSAPPRPAPRGSARCSGCVHAAVAPADSAGSRGARHVVRRGVRQGGLRRDGDGVPAARGGGHRRSSQLAYPDAMAADVPVAGAPTGTPGPTCSRGSPPRAGWRFPPTPGSRGRRRFSATRRDGWARLRRPRASLGAAILAWGRVVSWRAITDDAARRRGPGLVLLRGSLGGGLERGAPRCPGTSTSCSAGSRSPSVFVAADPTTAPLTETGRLVLRDPCLDSW